MPDDGTYDLERDLRPLSDYPLVVALGCGLLAVAATLLGLVVWALVTWL